MTNSLVKKLNSQTICMQKISLKMTVYLYLEYYSIQYTYIILYIYSILILGILMELQLTIFQNWL